MKRCLPLLPGEPVERPSEVTDTRRQILNRHIPGNDQNGHIQRRLPVQRTKVIAEGRESSWWEYIPETLPEGPRPLIISRHGGNDGGLWQSYTTSWDLIAEREGLLVLYPDSNWPKFYPEDPIPWRNFQVNVDETDFRIRELRGMIDDLAERVAVDRSRIFLQGHSVGDMMTMQFAAAAGGDLAGLCHSCGPLDYSSYFDEAGKLRFTPEPTAACISFCSNNGMLAPLPAPDADPLKTRELGNLRFWLTVNGAAEVPRIGIEGDETWFLYTGTKAPVLYHEVLGRSHSQPLDEAEMLWDTFFGGLRRDPDGKGIAFDPAGLEDRSDPEALALCAGSANAYHGCGIVPLDRNHSAAYAVERPFEISEPGLMPPIPAGRTPENTEGFSPVLYAPAETLELLGCKVESDGRTAEIRTPDGRQVQAAAGNICVLVDGKLRAMERQAETKDGVLCLPIRWAGETLLGLHASERNGVLWLSRKPGRLSANTAALIKDLLL